MQPGLRVCSLLPPVIYNKNVDRINYVHYNVQRLGNYTEAGFEAVHSQLKATSLMTFQNRIALDFLLAEKGGVCALFGEMCCTFIPNNTDDGGKLTQVIEGLRAFNGKMKDHSGVDHSMWKGMLDVFGKYKNLVASVLVSIGVFFAILVLCGCCCIPCIRALLTRAINSAVAPVKQDVAQLFPLLYQQGLDDDEDYDDDKGQEEENLRVFPDLDPNPGDYE